MIRYPTILVGSGNKIYYSIYPNSNYVTQCSPLTRRQRLLAMHFSPQNMNAKYDSQVIFLI